MSGFRKGLVNVLRAVAKVIEPKPQVCGERIEVCAHGGMRFYSGDNPGSVQA